LQRALSIVASNASVRVKQHPGSVRSAVKNFQAEAVRKRAAVLVQTLVEQELNTVNQAGREKIKFKKVARSRGVLLKSAALNVNFAATVIPTYLSYIILCEEAMVVPMI